MLDIGNLIIATLIRTIPQLLHVLWPIILLFVVAALIKLIIYIVNQNKLIKSGIYEIDHMTGEQFETYICNLFSKLGYKVTRTSGLEDMGCDLVVEKDGIKTAVQTKRWNNPVKTEAVQEVVSSMGMYGCTKALVVTNNIFTWRTKRLANGNNVELWDRVKLVDKINEIKNLK